MISQILWLYCSSSRVIRFYYKSDHIKLIITLLGARVSQKGSQDKMFCDVLNVHEQKQSLWTNEYTNTQSHNAWARSWGQLVNNCDKLIFGL